MNPFFGDLANKSACQFRWFRHSTQGKVTYVPKSQLAIQGSRKKESVIFGVKRDRSDEIEMLQGREMLFNQPPEEIRTEKETRKPTKKAQRHSGLEICHSRTVLSIDELRRKSF